MKWLDLENWLRGRTKPGQNSPSMISKEELADYVRGHQLQLQEAIKTPIDPNTPIMAQQQSNGNWFIHDKDGKFITQVQYPNMTQAEALAEGRRRIVMASPNELLDIPSYTEHQLPNGKNYREMLLKMPRDESLQNRLYDINDEQIKLGQEHNNIVRGTGNDDRLNQINSQMQSLADEQHQISSKLNTFYTEHWEDDPNVLAHIRFNDRTIDGKKTLFLEELQSDWHQQGRKSGYKTGKPLQFSVEGNGPWVVRDQEGNFIKDYNNKYHAMTDVEIANRGRRLDDPELPNEFYSRIETEWDRLPDAPFKTSWPELAMKRMIRHAADNGYDKIAWTTGKQQIDRYGLAKYVQSLSYNPSKGHLKAVGNEGNLIDRMNITPEDLPKYIGKEHTDALLKSKQQTTDGDDKYHFLTGNDLKNLKVGGVGMNDFYDKIMPNVANKIGKKYGARVDQGEIVTDPVKGYTEPVHTMDIPQELKNTAQQQGFPLFSVGAGAAALPVLGNRAPNQPPDSTQTDNDNLLKALRAQPMGLQQ